MVSNVRILAKEAGCSPATVSRVLNDFPYVKRELRERVIEAARKLNYSLNRNCFLAVIPDGANFCGYLGHILSSLLQEASRRDLHVNVVTEKDLFHAGGTCLYDGIISLLGKTGLEKKWGADQVLPMVCVNSAGQRKDNILRVSSDNRQGIFLALDYLKRRGHRKIAFVNPDLRSPQESTDMGERQLFYSEWIRDNVPGFQPEISDFPFFKAPSPFNELVRKGITAILVPGEGIASEIFYELEHAGIRIPKDLSVITMEHDLVSHALVPAATTIGQDWNQLAWNTFDILEKIRKNRPVQDRSIPFLFKERQSVAAIE